MSSTLTDQLERIVELSSCRLSIEEIGDFVFGGFIAGNGPKHFLVDVMQAGIQVNESQGLPLAVPIPRDIGFFLIVWAAEWLSKDRVLKGERGIDRVWRRMRKIERRHGVEDEFVPWRVGEGPPEWETANKESERILDRLFVETLEHHGLAEIAALFVEDSEEFDRRRETGRRNFAELVGHEDVLTGLPAPKR
jgi:hypothetical protein